MRMIRLAFCLAVVTAMPVPSGLADPLPTLYDVEEPCAFKPTGSNTFILGVGDPTVLAEPDDGRTVNLDVLVMLDGVSEAQAAPILADAELPYAEIGIDLVPTYQVVSPGFVSTAAFDIIDEARDLLPSRRVPAEYDVVEVLTSKDITNGTSPGVAGMAYCLGGIHDDRFAFEVAEAVDHEAPPPSGGNVGALVQRVRDTVRDEVLPANQALAKISAHEMGHLLGGQHELATCGEGVSSPDLVAEGPCDLMFPELNFTSLHFGAVNARIVRGYALRYAAANDA